MAKKIFIEAGALAEPRTSGVGNTVLNIVRTLSEQKDFELHLIVAANKIHYLDRYHFGNDIKINKIFIPGKIMNLMTKLSIVPYMDVFFGKGVYIYPNFRNWPLLWSKNITYVHDMTFMRMPEFVEEKNLSYLRRGINKWLQRADTVVAVSRHSEAELNYFFPDTQNKSLTVYNGVDLSLFHPQNIKAGNPVLRKYGLQSDRYVIFLSNLEPRKNVLRLLEGFDVYRKESGDYKTKLLIVGGMGWRNEEVIRKIDEYNASEKIVIRPQEFVSDEELPVLINASLGLIHPALYEGFGLSPLQALACGKYVAVADNSSLPEVIGTHGHFMDAYDIKSITYGFHYLVDRGDKVNASGVEWARKFTWNETLMPLIDAVRRLSNDV